MKKSLIAVAAILCALAAQVPAQDYKFEVNRNISWVVIDQRGQADLHYRLTFTCAPGAHAIDIVDIGMPNGSYQLGTAAAKVNGNEVTEFQTSEYVKPYGVEVHLNDQTIQPGDSATLFFSIHLGQVLNRDDQDESYASFEFVPTWYGSEYVQGRTRLECNFVFPPGTRQDEPRYHGQPFSESWFDSSANAPIYRWTDQEAAPDGQYKFGASFPSRYVDAASIRQPPGLFARIMGGIFAMIGALLTFLLSTAFLWLLGIFIINVIISLIFFNDAKKHYSSITMPFIWLLAVLSYSVIGIIAYFLIRPSVNQKQL